jgi:hypothetical protein
MPTINYAEKIKEFEKLQEYSALTKFFRTSGLHAAAKLLRAWVDAGRPRVGSSWDPYHPDSSMVRVAVIHLSHNHSARRKEYDRALTAYMLRQTNSLPPDFKLPLPKKAPRFPTLERVKALRDKRTGHPKEKPPAEPVDRDAAYEQRKERRKLEVTFGHLHAVWYQVSTLPRSEDVLACSDKNAGVLMFFRNSGEPLWHIMAASEDSKVVFKLRRGYGEPEHLSNLAEAEEALIEFLDTVLE